MSSRLTVNAIDTALPSQPRERGSFWIFSHHTQLGLVKFQSTLRVVDILTLSFRLQILW